MKRICAILLGISATVGVAGCSSTPTNPGGGSGGGNTSATFIFSGTVAPGDTPTHVFTLPATAPLHLLFGSLTDSTGLPVPGTVTLNFGVEPTAGAACDPLLSLPVTAALKAQINVTVSTGAFCAMLTNTSGLPGTLNYSIRAVYGTPTDALVPASIDYASTVIPGGYTTRNFGVSALGTTAVVMDSISPSSIPSLPLGIGFQRQDGSGCDVSTMIIATRGSELRAETDPGKYCIKIFDNGTLSQTAAFSLRIVHP